MPTYAYRCDACTNQFEIVQRMADDPLDTCPSCSGNIRRVIHPVGVVFKGSGWYINDSRPKDTNATTPSETSTTDKSESKPESSAKSTSTESKSNKKTDAKTAAD